MNWRGIILFALGAAVTLSAGWLAFPSVLYETRLQPLDFSHRAHTEKAGMNCEDCHAFSPAGRFSGIPRLETCAGCHAEPVTESPEEKKLVVEYVQKQREIPWLVYARQPDNVAFSHAAHVRKAKLACEQCHGKHGSSEHLRPYQENRISGYSRDIWGYSISRLGDTKGIPPMKMDDCIACHRSHGLEAGCIACHK